MAEAKKTAKVGDFAEVKNGGKVTFPDGIEVTVTGGGLFLDRPGIFVVNGAEVTVK